MLPVDTLRISDHYEISFLEQYGEDIKRIVIPDYCASYSINDLMLSKCPNVEEFIIGKDTAFSFLNGVLYSNSGNKRSIKYIIKGTKEVHIDADITGISYWHGVDSVTIDKGNSTFVVQDHMLLSRRKNSLYFVFSAAEEVIIPEGVTAIHAYAFKYCDNLKKIVFPASYNWSGWYNSPTGPILYINDAMRNAEIIINGDKARYDNHLIMNNPNALSQSIYLYLGDPELCFIPANITSVHSFNKAFYNAKNFKVDENNPFLASVDGVILDKARRELLLYPPARDYFRIPTSVKVIKSHSVSACNAITDVVLPEHVDSLEMMAFSNCNCLKKVTKMNPKADIHKDAFFGCNLLNNKEEKPIDTQALMKELDQEIQKIKEASVPKEKKRQARSKKSKQAARKEFKFNDHVSFNLSEEFIISQDIDEEGNQKTELKWGEYFIEEAGETQYKFSASIKEMEANTKEYGKIPDSKELIDSFISGVPSDYVSRSFKDFANLPCAFVSIETPIEVPLGFLGNIVLKRYLVNFGVVSDGKIVCISADGYQNKDNDEHIEEEDILYEKMLEIIEGLSVDGEHIDLRGLDEKKLREEIEPIFSDSESTFSFGLEMPEEPLPEVRFAEDDDRKVIVDNKWSFTLPKEIELRFDSEHVDIMGNNTTAKYVLEGLEYNGRFFFDFELMQRTDFGMGTDLDVLGCRYDNAVKSENANQKIILDGDDLYVDLVSKPIFLFRSMAILRVRGEDLNPWDFQMGLDNMDQDLSARWDEIAASLNELATSITLLDTGKKTAKKKTTKKKANSNPDFVISNGVLRKYIGKATDIVIPDGVKEIADSTFSGYTKLKSVVVPEGVKKIGRRCFENCFALEHVTLPESLQELGGYAFVDCHELKEIHLSEKLKILGDSAFSECFKLQNVQIPKKIKEIDAFVFKNCDSFTHIVVPNEVTKIGFSAFVGCDNLEYLFIPKSVKEFQININDHPFAYCPKLTIYTPAGSPMQKFAEEQGIPYENANKGVTATKESEELKTTGSPRGIEKKEKVSTSRKKENSGQYTITDDIAKTYVLMDYGTDFGRRSFYDDNHESFPGKNKTDLYKLYAEVKSNRRKKAYKNECIEHFMNKSIKYRFDVITKKAFDLSGEEDYRDKRDFALLQTRKWYRPEEEREVLRLLDSMMSSMKSNAFSQLKIGSDNWTHFYSAKSNLEIVLTDYDRDKTDSFGDYSLFKQSNYLFKALVTVSLSTGGIFGYSVDVGNHMPWIWDVSVLDIWKAAMKNEVNDKRSLPILSESVIEEAYNHVVKIIENPKNRAEKLVNGIRDVYDNYVDEDKAKKRIDEVLNEDFLWYEFDKLRLRAYRLAKKQDFLALTEILEESNTSKLLEKNIQKIVKSIPERQAEKVLNQAKKDLEGVKRTISQKETDILDCKKEIEKDEAVVKEKEKALAIFEYTKDQEIEKDKVRFRTILNSKKESIDSLATQINELKKNLEDTQKEHKNTSFFKFSLKKELTAKIEDLNSKLKDSQDKLSEEDSKLTVLKAEYDSLEQKYQKKQEQLKKEIAEYEKQISTKSIKISNLNSLIANKKEETAELEDKIKQLEKKKKSSSK